MQMLDCAESSKPVQLVLRVPKQAKRPSRLGAKARPFQRLGAQARLGHVVVTGKMRLTPQFEDGQITMRLTPQFEACQHLMQARSFAYRVANELHRRGDSRDSTDCTPSKFAVRNKFTDLQVSRPLATPPSCHVRVIRNFENSQCSFQNGG